MHVFDFNYQAKTHIVFGPEKTALIAELIPTQTRVLLLYGGGSIKKNGTYNTVKHALGKRTFLSLVVSKPTRITQH